MSESVAIVGAGIAGLSAAHEFIKRGFTVHVYERRRTFGGKAASCRIPADGPRAGQLPGEHGFRFFPGWYRHLVATMEEIPYQDKTTLYQGATVADNLVQIRTSRLAWLDRPAIDLPLQVPRSATEALSATQFVAAFRELGLSAGEVTLFFRKLLEVAALSETARIDKLEKISWWDFLECSDPARSQAYQDFIRATTRTMVAAKAEEASAYTIGRIAVRTFLDTITSVDRVLNGPTEEKWITPWIEHLKRKGVQFHLDVELDTIQFDSKSRRVRQLLVEPVVVADARRLRALLARAMSKPADVDKDDSDQILSFMADLTDLSRYEGIGRAELEAKTRQQLIARLETARDEWKAAWSGVAGLPADDPAKAAALEAALASMTDLCTLLGRLEAHGRHGASVTADYFVLALPLEQLAYHVNRSQMLTFLAPQLRDVLPLSRHMDWMAGIQFYLNSRVSFSPGHLVGLDSPWALTAIDSTRFWKDVTLPENVKTVLSVDISAWDKRGIRTRKEAFNCSDDEIANEVWDQLEQLLNRSDQNDVLRRDMLIGGDLVRNRSYHLDENIVDLRDRKKQAFYERARGVRFNTLDLVRQGDQEQPEQPETRYVWGPHLRFNAEPLLVNRPGSRQLRPQVTTTISNLFLAGDYIQTESDLACMEGANEAARRAVNAVLNVAGSRELPCPLFPFSPGRQVAGAVMSLDGAVRTLTGAGTAAQEMQNRFWKRLALGVMRAQGNRQLP